MNLKDTMKRIGDSYQVDPDFTMRVLEAAKTKPVRRRKVVQMFFAIALFASLAVTATAAGIGLLERRLAKNEPNGLITAERIPSYLENHVNDVILDGTTEDGVHIIFTNLLAESRFVYFEVLAEREDRQEIDTAKFKDDLFFRYLGLHYGKASRVSGAISWGIGWGGHFARLDDGSEPGYIHCAVGLTLLQNDDWQEQLEPAERSLLTIQLLSPWKQDGVFVIPGDVLAETTVSLQDPENLRTVYLTDGRAAKIGALGIQIQGLNARSAKEEGLDEMGFGVVLTDGSRLPLMLTGADLSYVEQQPDEESWAALAYPEILDPSQIAGIYSGDKTLWIASDDTEP